MSETAFLFNIKSCLVYRYISVEQYESSLFTVNVLSYTKVSDKMTYANNADPDQTAPEGAIWSGATKWLGAQSLLLFLAQHQVGFF